MTFYIKKIIKRIQKDKIEMKNKNFQTVTKRVNKIKRLKKFPYKLRKTLKSN